MATFSDNFNRSNGSIGSTNYDQLFGLLPLASIVSNELAMASAGNFAGSPKQVLATDHEAAIDFDVTSAGSAQSVLLWTRLDNAAFSSYEAGLVYDGSSWVYRIRKWVGGPTTDLASTSAGTPSTGRMRFRAEGTALTLFVNDTPVLSTTDSSLTTQTRTGFAFSRTGGSSASPQLDNLTVTDELTAPFTGSFIRLGNGNLARVRMANGDPASVRLADGSRLE